MKKVIFNAVIIFLLSNCNSHNQKYYEYFEDGGVKSEMEVSTQKGDSILYYKFFFNNSNLDKTFKLLNNQLHDTIKTFYQNGQVKSIQNFNFGKPHGELVEYDSSGNILNKSLYDNGELLKEYTYSLNGDIVGLYTNGIAYWYFETGKLSTIICNADTLNIKNVKFDTDGRVIDYTGELDCLSKKDSILLDKTNINWIKEIEKFSTEK